MRPTLFIEIARTGRCGSGNDILDMNRRQKWAFGLWLVAVSVSAQTDVWRSDSLQEVVVTGTGTQHLLKNAPVQTEVITAKMLRNYGGRSLQDILAGLTASFAFNEDDMGAQMQLNGLGNDYILILVDGKRIHGDVGGQNDLNLIDPHNIEKIEIVKGAHQEAQRRIACREQHEGRELW